MQLPEAYRSLPRPSSALKPSHPPHSVVTSKPGPTAGVGAYTRRHRLRGWRPLSASPFTPDISLGGCISVILNGRADASLLLLS